MKSISSRVWKNVIRTIDKYFPYFATLVMMVLLSIVLYQAFGPENSGGNMETAPVTKTGEPQEGIRDDSVVTDSIGAAKDVMGTESAGEVTE